MMFPISRIAWHQGAGHIVSAVRKQREMNGGGGGSAPFPFHSAQNPSLRMMSPSPGAALPISWISSILLDPSNGPECSSRGGSVTTEPCLVTFSGMTLQRCLCCSACDCQPESQLWPTRGYGSSSRIQLMHTAHWNTSAHVHHDSAACLLQ